MTTAPAYGVRLVGVGAAAPPAIMTNHDLSKTMDTSHEWIVQRTGIHRRHIIDPKTESERSLATAAMRNALAAANMQGADLDMLIHASVTGEMTCPSNACRIAHELEATPAAAFDLLAACSGFAYGMNIADTMIRSGRQSAVGIVGCDALSKVCDYTERTVSILFGDGAGAAVLVRDDDPSVGCIYQKMGADGGLWDALYLPQRQCDVPEWDQDNAIRLGCLRMTGREVFKFAVNKFREVIEEALTATGLGVDDISQFVCHQSNIRIIEAAKEKLGLPDDKVRVNIDEYGNTSSGSVGLVMDELWREGRIKRGDLVVIVAFGGGMTWSSSVWKV